MSKSFVPNVGVASTIATVTRYIPITGGVSFYSTEAQAEFPVRKAGTFQNLYVNVITNSLSTTLTFTVRKSTADTAITVNYTTGQTGIKEDTSNTDAFAATDEITIKAAATAGSGTAVVQAVALEFVPDTATDSITFAGRTASSSTSVDSTTTFFHLITSVSNNNTEAIVSWRAPSAFSFTNFYVYIVSNTRITDVSFALRKNSSDTAQILTYTAGQTGAKEDTTNTVSVVAGDLVNYRRTTSTGGGTIAFSVYGVHINGSTGRFLMGSGVGQGVAIAANLTRYMGISGNITDLGATESDYSVRPRFDFNLLEMSAYVATNTIATSPTVLTVRDGGADSSITISYSAGQTGLKTDTTNAAYITGGTDGINYKVVTPNTSGTFTLNQISVLGQSLQAYTLTIESGAFTFTGQALGLYVQRLLSLASGSFALTGNDVALKRSYGLVAENGAFNLTGFDLSFDLHTLSLQTSPKPTNAFDNLPKVSFAELWETIDPTWAAETRTWLETISLVSNTSKPSASISNLAKPS